MIMIQRNIKDNRKDHGFTIVELLVVIVVIGILAAITIVSYTGITTRANGAKAVANSQTIQSVAEAINADNSKYPVTTGEFTSLTSAARIPSGITIQVTAPAASGTLEGTSHFQLYKLTATPSAGGKIVFWDYSTNKLCSANTAPDNCIYWGSANAASNSGTTGVTVFAS
jgi:prepilin-type N-terminal cleavage/methylation domain-containing protein